MRDDFACIVISHGRPECNTVKIFRSSGYTGKIYIVVDDEDKSLPDYVAKYGDDVHVFHKTDNFDTGDLGGNKGVATYARNECRQVAEKHGLKYYFMLDDDFKSLSYRYNDGGHLKAVKARGLDKVLEGICRYFDESTVECLGFGTAVDYIGGVPTFESGRPNRSVMGGYFLRTSNKFEWPCRYSEDSIADIAQSRKGQAWFRFIPVMSILALWLPKRKNDLSGGCISAYESEGSFKLRFYSVMYHPDCVSMRSSGDGYDNLIRNNNAYPKIISGRYKKRG